MIKVLLAESEVVVREEVKKLFNHQGGFKVMVEVSSTREILGLLEEDYIPDLIIAGWTLDTADSLSWVDVLKAKHPGIPVVLLTMLSEASNIKMAFQMGVSAYLLRNVKSAEFLYALDHVSQGGIHLSSELTHQLIKAILSEKKNFNNLNEDCIFSRDELILIQALANGLTNKQIGEQIFLSSRSIENHRANLIKKAGVANTAALVHFGMRSGLIV